MIAGLATLMEQIWTVNSIQRLRSRLQEKLTFRTQMLVGYLKT